MSVGNTASRGPAPHDAGPTGPSGPTEPTRPAGPSRRAGQAGRAAARLVLRHKLVAAVVAIFVVAAVAVSLATSGGGGGSASDPAAPGFALDSLTTPGQHITLSQYQGKPLIINFWASWCPPCQQETPLLASWYSRQQGHVVIVGLDENDTASSALQFARAKGVRYPIGVDPGLAAANAYGVTGLPQTFFLNAQHRIVDHVLGGVTEADLDKGLRLMQAST
jgi:cytochrome c biogenesis protein CcmG, thiol:disulfide interchange protein DsbE